MAIVVRRHVTKLRACAAQRYSLVIGVLKRKKRVQELLVAFKKAACKHMVS